MNTSKKSSKTAGRQAPKAEKSAENRAPKAEKTPGRYDPQKIEKKWQALWKKSKAFAAKTPAKTAKPTSASRQKLYLAEMFPYPSGAGLHVGHVRNFTIVDVLARFYAQQGLNVLRPFGYDTFGLPAENYAIKTGISPQSATKTNIDNFRNQAQRLGLAIDWGREINTSDPSYYRWTQWCFLQLYKHGLAYRKESYQWWCPKDETVLANEQVEGGKCWRCGEEVEKKKMKQWYFKITAYADELLSGLDELDWPDKIKVMQKNWIGRSEGAEIEFEVMNDGARRFSPSADRNQLPSSAATYIPDATEKDPRAFSAGQWNDVPAEEGRSAKDLNSSPLSIRVFTTRPDTLFGATFLVLAPEHPLIRKLTTPDTKAKVQQYCQDAIKKSEVERQENKVKTGVFSGSYAKNPATGEKIPIWISDYVLANYGEGAVMAVPAHDERDNLFAKKYNLPIIEVIERPKATNAQNSKSSKTAAAQNAKTAEATACYAGEGKMLNSGQFTGQSSSDAREQIEAWLEEQGIGKAKTTYRMRDWLISRQRYWGCPIPIAYDKNGEPHPIPEKMLPVIIPEVEDYQPDHSGRSALAKATDWLNLKIKASDLLEEELTVDGADEKFLRTYLKSLADDDGYVALTRETDTLDGYACSSWYLWRYVSPRDDQHAWDPAAIRYWAPTDIYVGGDHATAHLLYIRFWCKFFADHNLLPFREPIKTLLYNGYINAPDGKKMSKSKGNVIDPLDVIDQGYGADTLRTYEMFIGPYDQDAAWDTKAIGGVYRFLSRSWGLVFTGADGGDSCAAQAGGANASCAGHKTWASAPERSKQEALRQAPLATIRNKTVKRVTEDLHRRSFNTAVAAMMEYVNELYKLGATLEDKITLAKLLKPFAPHLASEMLEFLNADDTWPEWDEAALKSETAEVVVQINGKLRARLTVSTDDLNNDAKLEALALEEPNVQKHLDGKKPKKIIIPKNHKIINLVV